MADAKRLVRYSHERIHIGQETAEDDLPYEVESWKSWLKPHRMRLYDTPEGRGAGYIEQDWIWGTPLTPRTPYSVTLEAPLEDSSEVIVDPHPAELCAFVSLNSWYDKAQPTAL